MHISRRESYMQLTVQLQQKIGITEPLQSLIVFYYLSFKSITLKHGNYVSPCSYYVI